MNRKVFPHSLSTHTVLTVGQELKLALVFVSSVMMIKTWALFLDDKHKLIEGHIGLLVIVCLFGF